MDPGVRRGDEMPGLHHLVIPVKTGIQDHETQSGLDPGPGLEPAGAGRHTPG